MADVQRLLARMSPSGFDAWGKCEAAWMFRYVEGLWSPPSGAMAAGTGFDGVTNDFYLDRLAFGETMTEEAVSDHFATSFKRAAADVENWGDESPGGLLDEGVRASRNWRAKIGVFVVPTKIQPKIEVEVELPEEHAEPNSRFGLSNRITLPGYADLVGLVPGGIEPVETVIDHKFSKRPWGANDVLRETQPIVYSLALGIPRFQFHIARRLKTSRMKVLGRTIGEADRVGMLNRYAITRRKIAAACTTGDFLPNRKSNLCSRKWCGYWETCETRFGGRVPE